MELFSQPEMLERYLETHSTSEDPVLAELTRHTYLKEVHPNMLSGRVLGGFLTLFSQLLSPSRILEVGTYTGYSAICLAKGLKPGGKLTTLELNDELRQTTLAFFEKAGVSKSIELINGDALQIIPVLPGLFDLVFLDADKENYPVYYEMIVQKVVKGGYILADNVLWGGKVLGNKGTDPSTRAIQKFNQLVTLDPRVENLLFPIRDGLMVIKKL
ncbi:MAG: O-methyltransferase [Bacteroidales bacterium]